MSRYLSLVVFLLVVFAAASSGAKFSPGQWYASLNKPWWTPPGWVFPVVWTVLYTMIAIAGWLIWQREGLGLALTIWGVGLLVNAAWSYLMFGRQDITGALIDVALLWVMTAAFIAAAWPIDVRAAYLFMPYLLWVTIAATLNFEVWRMN